MKQTNKNKPGTVQKYFSFFISSLADVTLRGVTRFREELKEYLSLFLPQLVYRIMRVWP